MTHLLPRITTFLASLLVSAMVLAAPKPFDNDLVAALANGDPLPIDEELVMHRIVGCSPFTTPGLRICQEQELDLNGDSIWDMIVGVNEEAHKRYYQGRAPGEGLFNPAVNFGIVTPTSGLKFADLNNDGYLDMVESVRGNGTTGTNSIYVNRNNTLESLFNDEQSLDSPKHDRSSSVAIGDVNNDGKLDIVIGNETVGGHEVNALPQTNYLYLNQTTAGDTAAHNVVFGSAIRLDAVGTETYTRRVLLIDAEGDGDLDIVATSADTSADEAGNGNVLYVNKTLGTGSPPSGANPFAAAVPLNASVADDTDVANAIAAGDIDGDGDPDLVFSTWSKMGSPNGTSNRYYVNKSTPGNIDFETTGTFGPNVHSTNVRLGNFDNAGGLDVVMLTFEGKSRFYRNTGTPSALFESPGIELDTPTGIAADQARGVDSADLNNDGSLDLVIVNRDQLGLRYLNNDLCPAQCVDGPFENYGPHIVGQVATAVVPPPGTAPVNLNNYLDALNVTDNDNVYTADFKARPIPGATYTCTNGEDPSGPDSGTCVDGWITPTTSVANIPGVDIKVSDGEANEPLSNGFFPFVLTVGTGSAPTFTTTTLPTANEDASYTTLIVATDPDIDNLTFYEPIPSGFPGWLTINEATGELHSRTGLKPLQADVGNRTITIGVEDSGGLKRTQDFTLTVNNVNDVPTVTTTSLPNGTQGQVYPPTTVTANDEDPGATRTFASTGLPNGLLINTLTGVITGTPTVSGSFTIVLTATDNALATSAPVDVPLTIAAAANSNPVLTAPAAQTATVGAAFVLTVVATDADSDPLSFSAANLPAPLLMSAAGVISGTPTTAGAAVTVTVTVNDGRGGTDSKAFQLTVQAAGVTNLPPTLTAPGAQTATVGQPFTLTVSATDPNSDPLSFSQTGLPAGLAISAAGVISGTPTTAGAAVTVTVTVNDGKGGTDSEAFQLTVQAAGATNRAPTFTAPGAQTGTVGTNFALSLAGSAADADGDTLSFAATGLPPGINISSAGNVSGAPTTAGAFTANVTVSDGKGGQATGSFQITVSNPTSSGGGGSGGGGGSVGLVDLLGMLGIGALAAVRRRRPTVTAGAAGQTG